MRNSLSKEARQVYACMDLHTVGFQREIAVIMENGKERALTLADVQQETKLELSRIRRAFRKELEPQDLAKRRSLDGGPLKKGNIELVSGAEPKLPIFTENVGHARPKFPEWFPESWNPLKLLIRRLKIEVPSSIEDARVLHSLDGADREEAARVLILRVEAVALDLEKAHNAARAFMDDVCAQRDSEALIRKKESERKIERNEQTDRPLSELQEAPVPDPVRLSVSPPPLIDEKPISEQVHTFLTERFRNIKSDLKDPVLSQIAAPLKKTPGAFEAFKSQVIGQRPPIQAASWKYFPPIAEDVAAAAVKRPTFADVCDTCEGTGRVIAITDRGELEMKCRNCNGTGQRRKPADSEHAEPKGSAKGAGG